MRSHIFNHYSTGSFIYLRNGFNSFSLLTIFSNNLGILTLVD
ncbi:hypothetical protein QW060_27190 [Myroides ceti]|uniref:Uncharacterized protein n=1 Tax=Paenimyroides ceti TaxID=395087 RepID=A0ABT8D1S7_9FLAO|nr:hypothetical protein [Paenimyroides ceti]MDN3710490.1 hypothetical protein [Paenimyroides ceti]